MHRILHLQLVFFFCAPVNLPKYESCLPKYVGGLQATRSLGVEVQGIWSYVLVFSNLHSSSYVLFTVSPNDYSLTTNCNPTFNWHSLIIVTSHSILCQKVFNLDNLNVNAFGLSDQKRITNAFPNDFNKFPFDKQTYNRTNESVTAKLTRLYLKTEEDLWFPQSALRNKF